MRNSMEPKKPSRLESNKKIRTALVKNGADMAQVNYSCHGRSVSLNGKLCKTDGTEMNSSNVEMLVQDISSLGLQINSELENWYISDGSISKKRAPDDSKEKKKAPPQSSSNQKGT